MEFYDRQKDISMNTKIKVAIVGCGGVGYWVAKFLAMSGVNEFHLFDNDVLEVHNLNRLDLPIATLGMNKAEVSRKVIQNIRPDAAVKSIPFKFKSTFLRDKVDVIIDCTDKIASQQDVYAFAKASGIKYMKVGYDGTHITIANKVAGWGHVEDGYQITPSWVVPAVMVASMAVGSILKYFGKEISTDINMLYNI
jgi:tRNA A37 threonylcarbamoyladenosine dehydratase